MSYILYSLYAPHPISINPFKTVLYAAFIRERESAVKVSNTSGVSENEQLVWVLWKILKGDGGDVSDTPKVSQAYRCRAHLPLDRSILTEHTCEVAAAAQTPGSELGSRRYG